MPICCDNWVRMLFLVSSALQILAPLAVPATIVALTEVNWLSSELMVETDEAMPESACSCTLYTAAAPVLSDCVRSWAAVTTPCAAAALLGEAS